jgi:beta-aspartyl-peptidase (threonine type)
MEKPIALALHGGCGTILRQNLTASEEAAYEAALKAALQAGWQHLERGASALVAVEAAVRSLEDCPLFNAGRGSVFTATGIHEMDAAIMEGHNRRAGAVAGVRKVRNPITLARAVMENSGFVLLCGEGAETFAREQGIPFEEAAYFATEARWRQLVAAREKASVVMDHDPAEVKFGTVGAVALDLEGNLAAATSTGGLTNKRYGRIGDSPIIGSGTYADNRSCAVSCTGYGEEFIRSTVARDVAARMEMLGEALDIAAAQVIHERLLEVNGSGGLIAVDAIGNVTLPFNTEGMYRAWRSTKDDSHGVAIFS